MYYIVGIFIVLIIADIIGMCIQFKKDDKMIQELKNLKNDS